MRKLLISLTFVCFQCLFLLAAGQNNYNKPNWPLEVLSWDIDKAYPGIEYNYRLGVKGGEYPYEFTLVEGPSGMTINKNTGEIVWKPAGESENNKVIISITDISGKTLVHRFAITSTTKGFYFVDGAKGNNSNNGSEASPWKTMAYASATADSSSYVYVRKGTYNETFVIAPKNCGRFMAYPGESVTVVANGTRSGIGINGGKKRLFQGFVFDANGRRWFFSVQGNTQKVIWRKNEMRNVYDESMENPAFIFFWNQETLYTNMVIQDNTFHDLRDPKGQHGASVTTYAVTNSLYEDNHAYDIDGRGVNEKVKGKRNTFRNNVFHNIRGYQGVVLNSNPSSDSTEICYNLIYDCSDGGIQIGLNGAYVANIFVHHNTILGGINLSGLIDHDAQSANINIYANIISTGDGKAYSTGLRQVLKPDGVTTDHYEYPMWFQTSDPKVKIDGNLIWTTGSFVAGYGWGIPGTSWTQWQAHGYDLNGDFANPGLDANYALPPTSPYYGIYGRDHKNSITNVDASAPTVPTNLKGTATSQTAINLTWSASTDAVGVTGYRIYRNGTQVGTIATTSFSDKNLTASTQYAYRVAAYDAAGNVSAQCTAVNVTTLAQVTTSTPDLSNSDETRGYSLSQNNPNPFKHFTQIEFALENAGFVTLKIYDINGREIASLINGIKPSGKHTVQWNGTSSNRAQVGDGVYFYQLKAGASAGSATGWVDTKKMILSK